MSNASDAGKALVSSVVKDQEVTPSVSSAYDAPSEMLPVLQMTEAYIPQESASESKVAPIASNNEVSGNSHSGSGAGVGTAKAGGSNNNSSSYNNMSSGQSATTPLNHKTIVISGNSGSNNNNSSSGAGGSGGSRL